MSITVENLNKRFWEYVALHDINLHITEGELVALLGPSGSGKTTLLRIIAGLELPDSGSVQFNGDDITSKNPRDRNVGFVFQHYALFRHMTVARNVAFGLDIQPRGKRPSRAAIRARAQSLRLSRLAADLLDLSRIDADVALRSESVELAEMGRAVLAEFELAAAERGVKLVQQEQSASAWATGDPGSIARILRILLDNALRVAPRDTAVTVTVAAVPQPSVSVADAGPGIAPEERALIFERFKRGRDTGGQAGFGLGLAIGRELAKRMHGTLELADGDAPGATFTLTLPSAAAPAAEPLPSTAGV